MRSLSELPAWERLFKEIIWKQLGEIKDQCILDFGSGEAFRQIAFFHHLILKKNSR